MDGMRIIDRQLEELITQAEQVDRQIDAWVDIYVQYIRCIDEQINKYSDRQAGR